MNKLHLPIKSKPIKTVFGKAPVMSLPGKTTIGEFIAQSREKSGLSQRELARLSGVPARTIANVERDYRKPSIEAAANLFDTLANSAVSAN